MQRPFIRLAHKGEGKERGDRGGPGPSPDIHVTLPKLTAATTGSRWSTDEATANPAGNQMILLKVQLLG